MIISLNLTAEQVTALENQRLAAQAPPLKAGTMTLEQYCQTVLDTALIGVIAKYRLTLMKRLDAINATEIPTANFPAMLAELGVLIAKYRKP